MKSLLFVLVLVLPSVLAYTQPGTDDPDKQ